MSIRWLNGRNVIVSGCSTGIGRELTLMLVKKHGCNVVGIARNEEKLKSLKKELGDKFTYRRFDVSNKESWENFSKELEEIDFEVDVLINNAGMIHQNITFADMKISDAQRLIDVNYKGLVYACSTFVPKIKQRPYGGIVNIASGVSRIPMAGQVIYTSTKSAVEGFTTTLYQELRGYGTFVCCIMPGPVGSDLFSRDDKGKVSDSEKVKYGFMMSPKKAATKIRRIMIRRKSRLVMGVLSKFSDTMMRLFPRFTNNLTSKILKAAFLRDEFAKPTFIGQVENKKEIREKIKFRKRNEIKASESKTLECIKEDIPN